MAFWLIGIRIIGIHNSATFKFNFGFLFTGNFTQQISQCCFIHFRLNLINLIEFKRRSILCVTQQLLLDGWTDLHETLGVYITRLGLLHGVLFHFRSEPRNRKCDCFRKPEVGTGSWKYSRWKENKILGQKYYSTFLIFWPGEASESSKDFFFPCKSIWASHIK